MLVDRKHLRTLSILFLTAAATLQGCKKLPRAVKNRQRLEAEVALTFDGTFAANLEGSGPELRQRIAKKVLERADMGLRFYPVLSESYAAGQARPEYLLTVSLSGFEFDLRRAVKRQKDGDTETFETLRWLDKIRCTATIQMQKRRAQGPALLVARDMATVNIDVRKPAKWDESEAVLRIQTSAITAAETELIARSRREEPAASQTPAPVSLPRKVLERAIDDAVQFGMRKVIKPIDHELLIAHLGLVAAAPTAPTAAIPVASAPTAATPAAAMSTTSAPATAGPFGGSPAMTTPPAPQTHRHAGDANLGGGTTAGNPLSNR